MLPLPHLDAVRQQTFSLTKPAASDEEQEDPVTSSTDGRIVTASRPALPARGV